MTIAKPWRLRHKGTMAFITGLPTVNQEGYHHGGHRDHGEQAEKKQGSRPLARSVAQALLPVHNAWNASALGTGRSACATALLGCS